MSTKRLTDAKGHTIAYIPEGTASGRQRVQNPQGQTVGYIDQDGTYDPNNQRIANYPDPGLLLKCN